MLASGYTQTPKTNGSTKASDSQSFSVVARRQRSKELAQKRRTTYKSIMDELTQALPFPKDVVSQLDYNSRLRLALCFFKLKALMGPNEQSAGMSSMTDEMIAKEKEVDQRLVGKETAGMMQGLMNEALDGFLMVALTDGTITYLSESIHKHLGLFQSEHIGISLYDLIIEEDEDSVKRSIHNAEVTSLARLGHNASAEVGFFCRMKCSRFKVTNTIAKTPGYKLVYISGSLKLSGNEAFLVVVVRPVSPPSILELKVEGNMFVTHYSMEMKCTFFDGRLNQLMGYRKKDLLGDVVFTLHHHDDTEATMECSRGVMSRGEGLSGYFRFLTKHGYYVWLQTRATVMYDSRTGKPSYIVCMNFLIDKEKGDTGLKNRAITATEDNDLAIKEVDSRSHDPFPLVSREDGKTVNPLDEADQSVTKNEVTSSSCTDISLPDSNPSSTVSLPEERMLPDSTSTEPDSSMGMIRTNTGTTSRSSDAGYNSGGADGRGMFSPNSGVSEVSSFSSNSPLSDVSIPQRKSSWESPSSSAYMTSPLECVSDVSSLQNIPAATHGIVGVYATIPNTNSPKTNISSTTSISSSHHQNVPIMNSSPQAVTSSHTDQPRRQNSHLSSLLLSSDTHGPNQGYSVHSNLHQVNNTHQQPCATRLLGKRNTAGSLHIKQEDTLTQERYVHNGQLNQPGGYTQTNMQQHFAQSNDLYANVPPLLNMYPPDLIDSASQPNSYTWDQTMPQGDMQHFTSPMHVPYQQHSHLPDWQGGRVTVKNEFQGFDAVSNQQFQQVQALNGQNVTSQPATNFPQHSSTFNTALQPQDPIIAVSANIQASCTVSNQHLPMGVPSLPDQLPLLTGEDLRVLDDIGSYT